MPEELLMWILGTACGCSASNAGFACTGSLSVELRTIRDSPVIAVHSDRDHGMYLLMVNVVCNLKYLVQF